MPINIQFAKDIEPLKHYYLEAALSREDIDCHKQIRQSAALRSP